LDSLKLIHGQQWREQLVEEIRTAQRALELLAGLERRLKERDHSDLEEHLGHLERLAGSLLEAPPCGCWSRVPSGALGLAARAMPVRPRADPARRPRGDSLRCGVLLAAWRHSPASTRRASPNKVATTKGKES
jgi:hypothetical protein